MTFSLLAWLCVGAAVLLALYWLWQLVKVAIELWRTL